MNLPRLTVFDMAGTTVEITSHVPDVLADVFAAEGIQLGPGELSRARGRSKREAIGQLLDSHLGDDHAPALFNRIHARFQRELLGRFRDSPVRPVDGTEDLFAWLRSQGVSIALGTGFDRPVAELLVQRLGWQDRIDALVSNDDVPRGRPAPFLIYRAMEWTGCDQVASVAAAGDTVADLGAGHNAGAGWNIGVLSGAHGRDELAAMPHTALINSVAELPGLFR
ncbi:MAG: HAD hydrolase-like protein [Xanthomonadales bacterium]|nr:HAD hydrolase-like protein [Xanthomonadales bacterium]